MTKALFFDIDGTLVSFNSHQIPQSAIEAITAAHANGHKVFIATGRPKVIINNITELQKLGIIDGYITMNGAYCFIGDQVIYKEVIPKADVRTMAMYCQEEGAACFFVGEHHLSICQPNQLVKEIFYDFLQVEEAPISRFEEVMEQEIFQMTPFLTAEQEKEVAHLMPTCEFGRWHPAFADVTARNNTKQKGIDEVIRVLGIPLESTVAIGDGGNDISMLRHAAIGVAMGQANEEVKAAADYVTSSVDEDGIRNALLHLNLI